MVARCKRKETLRKEFDNIALLVKKLRLDEYVLLIVNLSCDLNLAISGTTFDISLAKKRCFLLLLMRVWGYGIKH